MAEITVSELDESDWQLYRKVRLDALRESPSSFTARYAEEADLDEKVWRELMRRSVRLLAHRGAEPLGIASLGAYPAEPRAGEVFGLYVLPDARGTGISWRLMEAAAAAATRHGYQQIFYWAGVDNAAAVGFAKNFGLRLTDYRRPSRPADRERGAEEVALVLQLDAAATAVPNPTSPEPRPQQGPIR